MAVEYIARTESRMTNDGAILLLDNDILNALFEHLPHFLDRFLSPVVFLLLLPVRKLANDES